MARQRRRPHQAASAIAKQIENVNADCVVEWRRDVQRLARSEGIPRLVEVDLHPIGCEVDDVGGAGAVDVCEAEASSVEQIRVLVPWRVVYRDLAAKPPITEIRPVTGLAVADANDIGQ